MNTLKLLPLAIAFAPLLAAPAHAVTLDARGTGQVLLYPLYSVDNDNQTIFSIVNTTARGKALRVGFYEGFDHRPVLSFNVYLSPFDVWTAALFSRDRTGPANILTNDTSCTAPSFSGVQSVPFRNFGYSGAQADGGSSGLERTREGTIEVIEMGSVVPGSTVATLIAHVGAAAPTGCPQLSAAFSAPDGFWVRDPATDLANPSGGLYGSGALVNVANGTMWPYDATALEEFRQDPLDAPRGSRNSVVLHTAPGQAHPDLSDAVTDPARGIASATVFVDGRTVRVDYPAATRSIDAVSAALAAGTLDNEYVIDSALGARSDWVIDLPTRNFYSDRALVGGTPIAPFTRLYDAAGAAECMAVPAAIHDREGRTGGDLCAILDPPPPLALCRTAVVLCNAVQTVPMNQVPNSLVATPSFLAPMLGATLGMETPTTLGYRSGWMSLDLAADAGDGAHRMRPANDGTVIEGLPAIGFLATNFVNASALPGLLANYSGAYVHHATARCSREAGPCP